MSLFARLDPVARAVRKHRERLRARAGLEARSLRLPGGGRVAYLDGGTAGDARPPLLLLHGIGADKDHWPRLAARLRERLRVVAPDLPGFGQSDRPAFADAAADYTMPGQAATVVAFADALGLETFHLGGSSMGGRIAAELAARHPGRVRTLWLMAPAGARGTAYSEMIRRVVAGEAPPLFARTPDEYAAAVAFTMRRPPDIPRPALRVLAAETAAGYDLHRAVFRQMTDELAAGPSTEDLLRGLPVPTLVTWGEDDRVLHPSGADTLAAAMPRAEAHRMPGIGHLPMLEDPDALAARYLAFLDAQG